MSTPRRGSRTAASSAWARRSAFRRRRCTHAGPMGLEELTSYKYIVYGNGMGAVTGGREPRLPLHSFEPILFFSLPERKRTGSTSLEKKRRHGAYQLPLNLDQKISVISRPLRRFLPPERSLRSAHRLSAELRQKIGQQPAGPPSSRSRAARSSAEVIWGGQVNRANELSHDGGTVRTSKFGSFSFLSSPGATVLFFLKEEKEKNGGRKNTGGQGTAERSCDELRA